MIPLDLHASIDLYRRDLTATILGSSNVSQPIGIYYITIYAIKYYYLLLLITNVSPLGPPRLAPP